MNISTDLTILEASQPTQKQLVEIAKAMRFSAAYNRFWNNHGDIANKWLVETKLSAEEAAVFKRYLVNMITIYDHNFSDPDKESIDYLYDLLLDSGVDPL